MSQVERTLPKELTPLLADLDARLEPVELWLFGSRARGDARPDSDWDLLAVVEDGVPEEMTDPVLAWQIARASGVPVTLLVTRRSELAAIWGRPNTIGYHLAREGIRLRVD